MDSLGQNALHFAARSEHDGIVQYLTQYVKNYEKIELPGWISPLGTVAAVRSLVKVENLIGQTLIVLAAFQGQGDVVQHLSQWEDVSLRSEIMFGLFPIHLAAQRGGVATYRLLAEGCRYECAGSERLPPLRNNGRLEQRQDCPPLPRKSSSSGTRRETTRQHNAGSFDYSLKLEKAGGT